MKKLLMVLCVLVLAGSGWASDYTINKGSITISDMSAEDATTYLTRIRMGGNAGLLLGVSCDNEGTSENSDDYSIYIFDNWYSYANDNSNPGVTGWWYEQVTTARENKTMRVYAYNSSLKSFWAHNDTNTAFPIEFTCDDDTYTNSLFVGIYNSDDSASGVDFNCKLRWILKDYNELPDVSN